MIHKLPYFPLAHAGIRKIFHPRLKVEMDSQTAIRYLRFINPVKINHLELARSVYGRWTPSVPTHPAHLILSVPDLERGCWRMVKEIDLPQDPRTAGEGLHQLMSIEAMEAHFASILSDPPYRIDLEGLETNLLRVECDREHPVWPSHGECSGGPYNVPFGILDSLTAYGEGIPPHRKHYAYHPGLSPASIQPSAPAGMRVTHTPVGVFYESAHLKVGFSLRRPLLVHLGWDILGQGQAAHNRLKADWAMGIGSMVGGLSGPLLKAFDQDFGAQHWTGEVRVQGNMIEYTNLHAQDGLSVNARFTVAADGMTMEISQQCDRPIFALEAETWRFAWDLRKGMTACAAEPTLSAGRSGKVNLPLAFATDGTGCLEAQIMDDSSNDWSAQVESYRYAAVNTCGLLPQMEIGNDDLFFIPQGERKLNLRFKVSAFEPRGQNPEARPGDGLRRHWGSVFSCFRPEHRGFSNNAASVNCHLSQIWPLEIAFITKKLDNSLDPLALGRFTIKKALLDGGGYGYFRNLYLDSDPSLLIAAGRLHQAEPDLTWLGSVEPGLREAAGRVLANQEERGLLLCRDLSGNSGSFRWSCNSIDVVGFGHLDAYVNALGYRALRNAAALFHDLGDRALANRCRTAAENIQAAYAAEFVNPDTGWVAGWRSRDGQLHDYAFLWINGPAIAFGLLEPDQARTALLNLEAERERAGMADGTMGLPGSLRPIDPDDHLLPGIWGAPSPTFEGYTDGGLYGFNATYYLRALSIYGLKDQAARLASQLDAGLAAGYFNGGMGMGTEFRSWEGLQTGYEGTLIGSFGPVYSLAIEQGLIQPTNPEWWPAEG